MTAARLRQLADAYESAAAQMRSVAELLERDPDNPDVDQVVGEIIERVPALEGGRA